MVVVVIVCRCRCVVGRAEGSATGGAVISKQEFDFYLEGVLAPRLKGRHDRTDTTSLYFTGHDITSRHVIEHTL